MSFDYNALLEDARLRREVAKDILDSIDIEHALDRLHEIDPRKETSLYAHLSILKGMFNLERAMDGAYTILNGALRDIPILEEGLREQRKREQAEENREYERSV
jgi:hypothetical protein